MCDTIFPINEYASGTSEHRKHYLDSLIRVYPALLDANYCKYLLKKALQPTEKFLYTIQEHGISNKEYHRLVSIINDSGYWKLPFRISCPDVSDGDSYTLEAATLNQYKVVKSHSCPDDATKFAVICQEIIKCAGLEKKIQLVYSDTPTHYAPIIIQDVTIAPAETEAEHIKSLKNKK